MSSLAKGIAAVWLIIMGALGGFAIGYLIGLESSEPYLLQYGGVGVLIIGMTHWSVRTLSSSIK